MNKTLSVILGLGVATSAFAGTQTIDYTSWNSYNGGNPGIVTGTMNTIAGPVGVIYSGNVDFAQINDIGTQFWTQPNPASLPYTGNALIANAPTSPDIVALNETFPGPNTIVFSSPVFDPIMLINSLGTPSTTVSYLFDKPFTFLGAGQGFWGGNATTLTQSTPTMLTGTEGAGAIEFQGLVSEITWGTQNGEHWNGFTLGVVDSAQETVPDTGSTFSMLLAGLGSLGLLGRFRRR